LFFRMKRKTRIFIQRSFIKMKEEKKPILNDPDIRDLLDGINNMPGRHKAALEAGDRVISWACEREAQLKEKDPPI